MEERSAMSDSKKEAENFKSDHKAFSKKYCDPEFSNLNCQVQMISDSLAAFKQIAKHKQTNTHHLLHPSSLQQNFKVMEKPVKISVTYKACHPSPVQIFLPSEEQTLKILPNKKKKDIIVSFMIENQLPYNCFTLDSSHINEKQFEIENVGSGTIWNGRGAKGIAQMSSKVELYDSVDSTKLLEVIQRELRNLLQMAPFVAPTVMDLSNTIFHCMYCSGCSAKFNKFLPRILNRIQELVKYVTKRNRKQNDSPNVHSPLLVTTESSDRRISKEQEKAVCIGKLEKVEASALTNEKPGVQIRLSVKPEIKEKRLYDKKYIKEVDKESSAKRLWAKLLLKEYSYNLILHILLPSPSPGVSRERKQEVCVAIGFALAVSLFIEVAKTITLAAFVAVPFSVALIIERAKLVSYPRVILPCDERTLVDGSSPVNVSIKRVGYAHDTRQKESASHGLLEEAIEEEMHAQKVKDLEAEVKALKGLMVEVHKNQMELSKLLLEKGVYSQPIISLIDPNMLAEENQTVRKVDQTEMPQTNSAAEALQSTVDKLKRKCTIKNRMIVTLLKGLQSNVPKEWWEDLVDCIFNEAKPIEEFDPEKVNEFIRRTSLYLVNGQKATSVPMSSVYGQEKLAEGDLDSGENVEVASGESDRESDRDPDLKIDGEDIQMCTVAKRNEFDRQRTSVFIQKVLYEDSKAGIAVVDLFVAVKRAKDKLNVLTNANVEASNKMNILDAEAEVMKEYYRELVRSVNDFFDKMSDVAKMWELKSDRTGHPHMAKAHKPEIELPHTTRGSLNSSVISSSINKKLSIEKRPPNEEECGENEKLNDGVLQNTQDEASDCLLRSKDTYDDGMPLETFTPLISFSIKSSSNGHRLTAKESKVVEDDGNQNGKGEIFLSEAARAQGVYDICEILNLLEPEVLKWPIDNFFSEFEQVQSTVSFVSNSANTPVSKKCLDRKIGSDSLICIRRRSSLRSVHEENRIVQSRNGEDAESISESDSLFEEALSEPISDLKIRPSATFTENPMKGKKSAGTPTTSCEKKTSWMASQLTTPLLPEFKGQIAKMCEKHKKPFTGFDELKFKISTSTPAEYFNITVRQLKRYSDRSGADYDWSGESFCELSPEPLSEVESESGEDEMEEFIEVCFRNPDIGNRKDLIMSQKEVMVMVTLKQDKPPLFEIEKFHPQHLKQNMLMKKEKALEGQIHKEEIRGGACVKRIGRNRGAIEVVAHFDEEKLREISSGSSTRNKVEEEKPDTLAEKSGNQSEEAMLVGKGHKKLVHFHDELEETVDEREISEIGPDRSILDLKHLEKLKFVTYNYKRLRADTCLVPKQLQYIARTDPRGPIPREIANNVVSADTSGMQAALNLIRDIEDSVVRVNLGDAISMLPNLESELRKHLKKIREISESDMSTDGSFDDFFSAVDYWLEEDKERSESSVGSEERLNNLFTLLSNLEETVKQNEAFLDGPQLCCVGSSKIYNLLGALTRSINDLEEGGNYECLTEILNIASVLDGAVKECDSVIDEKHTNDCTKPTNSGSGVGSILATDPVKNVRKKVFEAIGEEATITEKRIHRDFDRIDRLQRENEESIKFVNTFLDKTMRRALELEVLKKELKILSQTLEESYIEMVKRKERETFVKKDCDRALDQRMTSCAKDDPVRNSVSALLVALDNLKSKAKKKNEICREILQNSAFEPSVKAWTLEKKVSRSSRSSFTTRTLDDLFCCIKTFKRIGESSLYMVWTNPEGAIIDHLVGYEIMVNGKLNQKVRNPRRTQAVLYSVDLTRKADVQLFALVKGGQKVPLATVTHCNA